VIMPRIKLKFEVLKWLEGTKNWAGNSLRLKELRFEFVFKVMEDVLFEGSGEEKKGDVNDPNIQKVITSAVKSEVIKRIKESPKETNHHLWEVAKYYLVVGQYEEALKYLGASVDIKSRRKYVYEARDCDLMIDVARVAGLKAYEALAWEYKAHAYNGGAMVRIEASLKALETAAGIYKEIGMANEVEDRLSALRKDLHKQKESALRKRAKVTAQKGQPRAVGAEGEGPPRAVGVERPEGPEGEGRKGPRERGRAK
jgi:tetratricopeptide (TPR) repeat protein